MKFFTPELWLGLNNLKSPVSTKDWARAWKSYELQLKDVLPRLNPAAQNFFKSVSLHDGTLVSASLGDDINDRAGHKHRERRKLGVELHVRTEGETQFSLRYSGVSRAEINYPGPKELFPSGLHSNLGDWGYDELTLSGKTNLRHEVLFSSGATLLIEFVDVKVTRKRSKKA